MHTTMATENNNKNLNVPNLRFPEFGGEWQNVTLSDIVTRVTRKNKNNESRLPLTISAQYGLVDQISFFNKVVASADMSNYYLLKEGEFAYNKSYSSEYPWGAIKRLDRYPQGALSSLYICFGINDNVDSDFLVHYFESSKWHREVSNIAGEGARNHGLLNIAVGDFFNTAHCIPATSKEQQKIAAFINLITERIATQIKIIEDLKKLKSAIRARVFKQLESNCECWTEIGNMLQYEQPSKYLVASTEYSDSYATPVLTANKAFILGYTDEEFGIYSKGECVIFDDFTMDVKFVNFPFKVKSSAIKILTSNSGNDLYFVYEYLQNLGLVSEEHKRHYISEIEPMIVACPTFEEQQNISNLLRSFDSKIEYANRELTLYNKQKQYLLSQMFI